VARPQTETTFPKQRFRLRIGKQFVIHPLRSAGPLLHDAMWIQRFGVLSRKRKPSTNNSKEVKNPGI
jgi:hypothetical protein